MNDRSDSVLWRVLNGNSDANISFNDLRRLLFRLGFDERIRGSHHIFTRAGIPAILNIQPNRGKAKPYQVRQVRNMILTYHLIGGLNGTAQI